MTDADADAGVEPRAEAAEVVFEVFGFLNQEGAVFIESWPPERAAHELERWLEHGNRLMMSGLIVEISKMLGGQLRHELFVPAEHEAMMLAGLKKYEPVTVVARVYLIQVSEEWHRWFAPLDES
jgi:hypothetical protein